jgi:hypothetical protein
MTNADEQIDKVLRGLNTAEVPSRLEQRVMARVAQISVERAAVSNTRRVRAQALVTRFLPYAVGAAVAVVLCAGYVTMSSHRVSQTVEQARVPSDVVGQTQRVLDAGASVHVVRGAALPHVAAGSVVAQTVAADDSDAIALAETQAPSHPAPPMAATPQERVVLRSERSSRAVEMAEAHEPGFRTERERTAVRQYILGLLDPLVTAQNLTPSPHVADDPPPPADDTTSTH